MKIRRNIAAASRMPILALAGMLAACASAPGTRTDFPVEVKVVPLAISEVAGSAEVLFTGGYLLESGRPEFGGFSGLVVEDHRRLIAVSDRGFWWEHPVGLSAAGLIELGKSGRMGPLYDFGGTIAPRGSDRHDAEEMTEWPGGQLVSYEGEHRIALYRRRLLPQRGIPPVAARRPKRLALPADLDADPKLENGGIEAMTRLADGRLAIFSEEQRDAAGLGLWWVGDPRRGTWRRGSLELFEDYVPTGAATLPGGDVLLLERSYSENRGVRGRVRRLPAAVFSPGTPRGPIAGVEILRIEPPESVDNFEGIEVIPMDDGRVFFLLLSDDNFNDSQRILLLQFELLAP